MKSDVFRWTPRQFIKASRAGWFDDVKAELLGGIVYTMTTNPPRMTCLLRLTHALRMLAPLPDWVVTKEDNVKLGKWLPLPDSAVLRGPLEKYDKILPDKNDICLIVEVSDTTYAKDRGPKYRRYASFKIPVYWIVDLNRRRVEVHSLPIPGKVYDTIDYYTETDAVPLFLDGQHRGTIPVNEFLP
jgi:Uma2 family endonuclease